MSKLSMFMNSFHGFYTLGPIELVQLYMFLAYCVCRCMCMFVLVAIISAEIALLSCSLTTCVYYCQLDLS